MGKLGTLTFRIMADQSIWWWFAIAIAIGSTISYLAMTFEGSLRAAILRTEVAGKPGRKISVIGARIKALAGVKPTTNADVPGNLGRHNIGV